ncbi:MAG: TadE/TadG family type IV pilus assembly protein [Pseudomonadota bacterium]
MRHLKGFLRRFARDEDGVAAFDFVLVFPVFFMLFLASFETGMLMTRQVLLDRGLDQAVRVVRLNTVNPPEYDELKDMVCQASGLIANCDGALKLEMWRQNPRGTMTYDGTPDCIDRSLEVQPASVYGVGDQNQMMFLRACVQYKPFFPTATIGTAITDSNGEYQLVATTVYVSEPR